jgi:hypothetical protein
MAQLQGEKSVLAGSRCIDASLEGFQNVHTAVPLVEKHRMQLQLQQWQLQRLQLPELVSRHPWLNKPLQQMRRALDRYPRKLRSLWSLSCALQDFELVL